MDHDSLASLAIFVSSRLILDDEANSLGRILDKTVEFGIGDLKLKIEDRGRLLAWVQVLEN